MKIIIGHYHLNPGGVTKIIQSQLKGLANKDAELLVVCNGQGRENIILPANARFKTMDKLGYLPNVGSAVELENTVKEILSFFIAEVDKTDIIHFHNIGLGKNVAVSYAMYLLAKEGYNIINHAHDFPEDRPANLKYIKSGLAVLGVDNYKSILYPKIANYIFGVLNSFDKNRLLGFNVPQSRVALWANPVSMPETSSLTKTEAKTKLCDALGLEKEKMMVAYPVRVIGRKNIGEYILLASVFGEVANFIVTLPPLNPIEIEPYKKWVEFVRNEEINLTFEAGLKAEFEWVMTGADVCFTTSIMEGFGMVFVEPWLWGTQVAGREISNVLPDLKEIGLSYPLIYDKLLVEHKGEWIDFPELDMKQQMQMIKKIKSKQKEEFIQQNPQLTSFFNGNNIEFPNHNKEVIAEELSERKYGEKLYQTYKALS